MPKIVDPDTRRQELIEAARAVTASEGLEGLTMRKIAKKANCTTGCITHYFADKETLILASLRTSNRAASKRVNDVIAANLSGYEKLLAMALQTLPLNEERSIEMKVWLAFWSAATTNKVLAAENDARMEEWLVLLIPIMEEIAPGTNARHEANLLIQLINGLSIQAIVSPSQKNLAMVEETVRQHLANLLS